MGGQSLHLGYATTGLWTDEAMITPLPCFRLHHHHHHRMHGEYEAKTEDDDHNNLIKSVRM
jgi:hypothetical protein